MKNLRLFCQQTEPAMPTAGVLRSTKLGYCANICDDANDCPRH